MKKGTLIASMAVVGVSMLALSDASMAATLGDAANTAGESVTNMKKLATNVFYFLGIIAFGMGIWNIWKESKQPNQDHGKKGIMGLIAGTMLLSMGWWMETLSATAGDTEESKDNANQASEF